MANELRCHVRSTAKAKSTRGGTRMEAGRGKPHYFGLFQALANQVVRKGVCGAPPFLRSFVPVSPAVFGSLEWSFSIPCGPAEAIGCPICSSPRSEIKNRLALTNSHPVSRFSPSSVLPIFNDLFLELPASQRARRGPCCGVPKATRSHCTSYSR